MTVHAHRDPIKAVGEALFHEPLLCPSSSPTTPVLVRDVDFASICAHTLLPFYGRAHIAYIPADGVVVGLSKVARVIHILSKRHTTPQRLALGVAHALEDAVSPLGTAVVIHARHLGSNPVGVNMPGCAVARTGILRENHAQTNHETTTTSTTTSTIHNPNPNPNNINMNHKRKLIPSPWQQTVALLRMAGIPIPPMTGGGTGDEVDTVDLRTAVVAQKDETEEAEDDDEEEEGRVTVDGGGDGSDCTRGACGESCGEASTLSRGERREEMEEAVRVLLTCTGLGADEQHGGPAPQRYYPPPTVGKGGGDPQVSRGEDLPGEKNYQKHHMIRGGSGGGWVPCRPSLLPSVCHGHGACGVPLRGGYMNAKGLERVASVFCPAIRG